MLKPSPEGEGFNPTRTCDNKSMSCEFFRVIYIVEFSIADMAHLSGKQQQIINMRPMIIRALALYQRPHLYRELFYTHLLDHNLKSACEIGHFIQKQR